MTRTRLCLVAALAAGMGACQPYDQSGEFYAGAVDPKDFPVVYRGAGISSSSNGTFEANAAVVRGEKVGYYPFPVPASVTNPLRPRGSSVYVFDPGAASPFPSPAKCAPPRGYAYNQYRDYIRFDEQGNIFTRLPARTVDMLNVVETFTYEPLVAEIAVTSNGVPCQEPKSATNIVTRKDVTLDLIPPAMGVPNAMASGKPDGKYLAWAIIDPTADVRYPGGALDPRTFLGPQKWGWFDHFLLAYIDGGYVPTAPMTVTAPDGMMTTTTVLVSQNIYVPSSVLVKGAPVPNDDIGTPSDVLQFKRGEAGYSPLCKVMVFTPPDPMNPAMNPTDAAMIVMPTATGKYVYCLQPEKQAP
jgi:hypothetical protein